MFSQEIKNRIRLSVAAYAYEFLNESIMSDHDYDELSRKIDVNKDTGNKKMDDWFKKHFVPDSGMWVRSHPEITRLDSLYKKYYRT